MQTDRRDEPGSPARVLPAEAPVSPLPSPPGGGLSKHYYAQLDVRASPADTRVSEDAVQETFLEEGVLPSSPFANVAGEFSQVSSPGLPSLYTANSSPSKPTSCMRAVQEEPPLKRQYSGADSGLSDASRGGDVSMRPARRAAAPARGTSNLRPASSSDKAQDWTITDEEGSQSIEPDGLHFLLRACERVDPNAVAATNSGGSWPPPGAKRDAGRWGEAVNQPARRVARRSDADSAAAQRRRSSQALEGDDDEDYMPIDGDEDADYRPARTARPARRAAAGSRAATQAVAAAAAAAGSMATAPPAPSGRWGGESRSLISGPCLNPDCEHPNDSPQWRKGPPAHPVLCNACGTRWLRNGTLKPLVPRRGLRYKNKARPAPAPKAQPQQQAALAHREPAQHYRHSAAAAEAADMSSAASAGQLQAAAAAAAAAMFNPQLFNAAQLQQHMALPAPDALQALQAGAEAFKAMQQQASGAHLFGRPVYQMAAVPGPAPMLASHYFMPPPPAQQLAPVHLGGGSL